MPPDKTDLAHVWDMVDAAGAVRTFLDGRAFSDYEVDRMLRRAVEREIEIIGEAARHVSESFQRQHATIPWRKIVAQRHVIAHEYGEIRHERLWLVATQLVPKLLTVLAPLLRPDLPNSES